MILEMNAFTLAPKKPVTVGGADVGINGEEVTLAPLQKYKNSQP